MKIWRCLKEWQWYPINPFWCIARCSFRCCYQEHCKAAVWLVPELEAGRPKSAANIGPQQQFHSSGRSLVSEVSTWSSPIISVWHSSQDSGSQSRPILARKLRGGDTLIIKIRGKLRFFVCLVHTNTHKHILYFPLFPSHSCLFNLFPWSWLRSVITVCFYTGLITWNQYSLNLPGVSKVRKLRNCCPALKNILSTLGEMLPPTPLFFGGGGAMRQQNALLHTCTQNHKWPLSEL